MSLTQRLPAILAASIIAASLGCGSTATKEGTGEYIDDTVITSKVKTAILREPGLKVSEINVETFKGVVQLSGFVGSKETQLQAVDLVRGVPGVKAVKDDMRVK